MEYDIFISYRDKDSKIATELYEFLKKNGYNIFFAKETINKAEYGKLIDEGLKYAKNLIVIASLPKYTTTGWIEYEWRTFHQEILSGRKTGQILTIVGDTNDIAELPLTLRNLEVFGLSEYSTRVLPFLSNEKVSRQNTVHPIVNGLLTFRNTVLKILPLGLFILVFFSTFFFLGFFIAHHTETTYDKLYIIAKQNIQQIGNGMYIYPLLEGEDVFYSRESDVITLYPKTEKTIKIYANKRQQIVENIAFFGIGATVTSLFKVKVKGDTKETVLFYVGGTISIICGYGIGRQVNLKYFPANESNRMKEFLSDKENWKMMLGE